MPEDEIVSAICEKDEQLKQLIESGKTLELAKCCHIKNSTGDIQYKKVAIKCSPEISSNIMNRNGGYIFVGLCKCKVYNRYFVPQLFHCYQYNHFSNNFPNKSKPAKCGKCAGQLKTVNCRSTLLKCINCLKAKVSSSEAHAANSRICPILIKERSEIQKRTNYSPEEN